MAVNAIDFSDLTKKPKPQGFQTPPIPQQNKKLGIKNLETGKVEPAMGYPVNQMGQGVELLQLFPVPIMICPYPVDYSRELEWIRNAETRKENKGDGSSGTGKPADPPPADPPPQESFVDAINKALRGGGGGFGGASLGHGGATEINDSMFDLGNANSVASQFLKTRNETVVNISVDPTLDAEARVDKTMSDINDRIQVKNRFRAL